MIDQDWDGLDADGRAWLSAALEPNPVDAPLGDPSPHGTESNGGGPAAVERSHPLAALFELAASLGASDIHLTAGQQPHVRVCGELRPLRDVGRLSPDDIESFIAGLTSEAERGVLRQTGDLDTAFQTATPRGPLRLRASLFRQAGSLAAAFRIVPMVVPSIEDLGLPPIVRRLSNLDHGLVLVTGRTGSGKSTTLAAMIETINRTRASHIVTIEDPIEYQYEPVHAVIQQREVGVDTESFAVALRHALRQDPDVILLGELRDLETIRTALTAAETGHLVLATLHSGDTSGAIHRIVDVFPADQQSQIRSQLALSLEGIVAQSLERRGDRLVAVTEAMVATGAVRNLIRDDKVHQLRSVIETGGDDGMHTMEQSRAAVPSW